MGSNYPILAPKEVIKALSKLGFEKVSQKGSHAKYRNVGEPTLTVIIPIHKELAKGTLKAILEQANISLDDFLNLL